MTDLAFALCALCGETKALRMSHIIPAFAIRWLRETSATGHMRWGRNPDLRAQDGPKRRLLCEGCEQRFSVDERVFANEIFQPFNADPSKIYSYDDSLIRFCTSISWRILMSYWEESFHDAAPALVAARDRWHAFLKGEADHPGEFKQHIIPLYPVGTAIEGMPKTINRYLLRALDGEFVTSKQGTIFTYAKIGRLAIFGQIASDAARWRGMTVGLKGGVIRHTDRPPTWLFGFLCARAKEYEALLSEISENQKDKIDAAYDRNFERLMNSESLKAMRYDADLFGESAVIRQKK